MENEELENVLPGQNEELVQVSEQLSELVEVMKTEQEMKEQQQLVEQESLIIEESETTDLIALIQEQNEMIRVMHETDLTINVYLQIVVPLFIISVMMWWLFKQFIYKYS